MQAERMGADLAELRALGFGAVAGRGAAGESVFVLEVPAAKLASYDPLLKRQSVEPGGYELHAVCDGSRAPAIRMSVAG